MGFRACSTSKECRIGGGIELVLEHLWSLPRRRILAKPIRLQSLRFGSIKVTERTDWTFAEVSDGSATEVVEITCGVSTVRVIEHLRESFQVLTGKCIGHESEIAEALGIKAPQLQNDRSLATAISCFRSAVTGLQARQDGVGLITALGGEPNDSVPVYANINRSLLGDDRTPEAFARAAQQAAEQGFTIVKCAPFDDIDRDTTRHLLTAAKLGIARVTALRSAVGPNLEILVDCHSCFDEDSAVVVAEELAMLNVGWFEGPLLPIQDPEGLSRVARRISMPIAGGESGYGETFFADLVRSGAVSIAMPDVKHCGGVAEACRAGRSVVRAGGRVSLHSPSGPVSQLASAYVTAAISDALALEHAVNEAPWRADLMEPPEKIEGGRFWFPDVDGAVGSLNMDVLKLRGTAWKS